MITSEIELLALVHVGRDVAEARRFHDLELGLEDARGVLVLVGPFEPDRHRDALEFLEVRRRQAVDLGAGLDEFRPGFHVGLLDCRVMQRRIGLDLELDPGFIFGESLFQWFMPTQKSIRSTG